MVGRVLDKSLHRIMSVIMKCNLVLFQRKDRLMFSLSCPKLHRNIMLEEKLYVYFVDIEKAFV